MINEMQTISFKYTSFKLDVEELEFCMLIFGAPMKKRVEFVQELKKVFDIEKYLEEYIKCCDAQIKVDIYKISEGRTSIRFERLGYGSCTGPYITIDKFLEVGMYGIEEYFEMQKNVDKYNL